MTDADPSGAASDVHGALPDGGLPDGGLPDLSAFVAASHVVGLPSVPLAVTGDAPDRVDPRDASPVPYSPVPMSVEDLTSSADGGVRRDVDDPGVAGSSQADVRESTVSTEARAVAAGLRAGVRGGPRRRDAGRGGRRARGHAHRGPRDVRRPPSDGARLCQPPCRPRDRPGAARTPENTRIWSRHVLNCAAVAGRLSPGDRVVDIGSGAGLPGIPLAIARPDVSVVLLEPLLRRATFLDEVVTELGLTNVTVVRSRAEEVTGRVQGTVVTARAVAPLPTLLGWALPLTAVGGSVVALRGSSATDEVKDPTLGRLLKQWGAETPKVVTYPGAGEETTTVEVVRRTLGTMGSALAKKAENKARREARKGWKPKPRS